ncbi:MAG: rhomboid family intramembrane serine protease [Phycisphaerales bacterium]|nr:rhomboid family intramembrane serine protease [Phycisphaerales bacterium]
MLIPLGTNRPLTRKPRIVPILIGINLAVFVLQLILQSQDPHLHNQLLDFGHVWRHDLTPWSPITSAFLHGSFMHIAGNMLALFVFGPPVEDRFGRLGFTIFYLAGAIGSGLVHTAASPYPAIGASGAIAAVTGAFLVLFPNSRIRILWFLILIQIMMAPAWWLIGLWIVIDLFSQTFQVDNGTANAAHLGGYAFGIAVALFLLATHILEREPYDLFSILKQKNRKRAFQAATRSSTPLPVKASKKPEKEDPKSAELAHRRAQISERLSEGNVEDAAARYLAMIQYFSSDEDAPTTMHRDAQYQIANHLYASGQRQDALDAYQALIKAYPNDKERDVICILRARINAQDLNNTTEARSILTTLIEQSSDDDIKNLALSELDALKD